MGDSKGKSKGGKRKGVPGESGKAKRQRYTLDITKGIRAYVCTCDQGKEDASARELIAWLDEAAEKYYPRTDNVSFDSDEEDDEAPAANVSLADALKAEIAELKQSKTKKLTDGGDRFKAVDSGTRGVSFIHVRDKSFDHGELMRRMLTDSLSSARMQTRFSIRIQVVHRTCFARMEDLMAMAKPVIDAQFDDSKSSDLTYAVIVSKRSHNADMSTEAMIPAIARLVPRRFKVNLREPDVAIVIQVQNRMAGIGVMYDFSKLMKYHIRKIGEQKINSRYSDTSSSKDAETEQTEDQTTEATVDESTTQATSDKATAEAAVDETTSEAKAVDNSAEPQSTDGQPQDSAEAEVSANTA